MVSLLRQKQYRHFGGLLPSDAQLQAEKLQFADIDLPGDDAGSASGGYGWVFQDPLAALTLQRRLGVNYVRCTVSTIPTPRRRNRPGRITAVASGGTHLVLLRYPHQVSGGQRQRRHCPSCPASRTAHVDGNHLGCAGAATNSRHCDLIAERHWPCSLADLGVVYNCCDLRLFVMPVALSVGPCRGLGVSSSLYGRLAAALRNSTRNRSPLAGTGCTTAHARGRASSSLLSGQ